MIYLRLYILLFLPQLGLQDGMVKTDLSDRWQVFQSESKALRPSRENEIANSLRLNLQRSEMDSADLVIITPDQPLLILNGQVIYTVSDTLHISLNAFLEASGAQVFDFTIYSKTGIRTRLLQTWLVKESRQPPDDFSVMERPLSTFDDHFIISALLIMIFLAFLVNKFPKDSSDYSNISFSLSPLNREEALLTSRPLGRNNLLFVALNALLIGFLLVALSELIPRKFTFHGLIPASMLLDWVVTSVVIFLMVILKFFLISIFNALFVLGEFRNIQFFNDLRISLFVSMLGFIVLAFSYLTFRSEHLMVYPALVNGIVAVMILRIIILFLKLSNYSKHKIFHLIFYLCATEIFPFILVYKIVLG